MAVRISKSPAFNLGVKMIARRITPKLQMSESEKEEKIRKLILDLEALADQEGGDAADWVLGVIVEKFLSSN